MKLKYKLSNKVNEFIKDSDIEEIGIGCSDSQVLKITKNNNTYFLKIAKEGTLLKEYNALKWLENKLIVPAIILFDQYNGLEFLVTKALLGEMICSPKMLKNPDKAFQVIKEAFSNLYSVDISNCPNYVGLDYKIKLIENNVKRNLIKYDDLKETTKEKFSSLDEIVTYLKNGKFEEELCFSHGDTSLPNIFAYDNHFSGFIDVGESGIADKWFDLAICEKSIARNFGKECVDAFYKTLKIVPDREKINYYLLMMELYL